MKSVIFSVATIVALAVSGPSYAADGDAVPGVNCAATDIDRTGSLSLLGPISCLGFFSGNLSNASNTGIQSSILDDAPISLVLADPFASKSEKISGSPKVSNDLNFDTLLYGETVIGIHWGNIRFTPSGPPAANNVTSFYKFNAGTNGLDKILLNFTTASNSIVYKTGTKITTPPPAVPEPTTWAMMIGGLGLVGASLRRQSNMKEATFA